MTTGFRATLQLISLLILLSTHTETLTKVEEETTEEEVVVTSQQEDVGSFNSSPPQVPLQVLPLHLLL